MEGFKKRIKTEEILILIRTALNFFILIGSVLNFLLRKKQIPAPYPINIRGIRKEKG